jgi:hypothetical protein
MNSIVERAMRQSATDFLNVVWPIMGDYFGGGELIPVEVVTDSGFTDKLDQLAGIDAWHILKNKQGMRALASRVQWRNPNWKCKYPCNTFTIRHETLSGVATEEEKRQYALQHRDRGLLFPYATVQAYLETFGGPLLSFGIIKTEELYRLVDSRDWPIVTVERGNKMKVLAWKSLVDLGATTLVYHDYTTGETRHV